MLHRVLKMAFWVTFDHLGKLLVANVFCVAALAFPGLLLLAALRAPSVDVALYLGVPVLVLTGGLVWPVLAVGLAHMTKELIETRDGSIRAFITGMRQYAWRAVGVGTSLTMAALCLGTSMFFYAYTLQSWAPWLGYALSAIALWGLVFSLLCGMFAFPALVQKRAGVIPTLRLSALLVMDNPVFSLGLALQFAVLGLISFVPPVLLCLSPAVAVVLASSAYEILSRKYAALEVHAKNGGSGKPVIDFNDAGDDYLSRGLRDLLFPWKS